MNSPYGIARFERKGQWQQWVVLPAEGQWNHSLGGGIDTEFMGPSQRTPLAVDCSFQALPGPEVPSLSLKGRACPESADMIDSGPEARPRQVYFDGSHLRLVLTVVQQQYGDVGIYSIDDQLWVAVDGQKRFLPLHGYEPLTVLVDLAMQPHVSHVIQFGTMGTTNGSVCI